MGAGILSCGNDVLIRRPRVRQRNVLTYRPRIQEGLIEDSGDRVPQIAFPGIRDINGLVAESRSAVGGFVHAGVAIVASAFVAAVVSRGGTP